MHYCRVLFSTALCVGLLALSACEAAPPQASKLSWEMGERVAMGPLTYVVVSSEWSTQLGSGFNIRTPQKRFLMLSVSVTNGAGEDYSMPLLTLQDAKGNQYQELQDGAGVGGWLGLLRTLSPAETKQGRVLFDVPVTSYQLALPDVSDETYERVALVEIPLDLQLDNVQAPIPQIDLQ